MTKRDKLTLGVARKERNSLWGLRLLKRDIIGKLPLRYFSQNQKSDKSNLLACRESCPGVHTRIAGLCVSLDIR